MSRHRRGHCANQFAWRRCRGRRGQALQVSARATGSRRRASTVLLLAAIVSALLGLVSKGRLAVYGLIAYPFLLLAACITSVLYLYRLRRAAVAVELAIAVILFVAFVRRWFFST
jgi:hypothetical protein